MRLSKRLFQGVHRGLNNSSCNEETLSRFGFRFDNGSAHTARTMMFKDLQLLFDYLNYADASKNDYLKAIIEENCLSKRSEKTRLLTARHLVYLYSLDPNITVFRVLRFFWERDLNGRPLLALLCSYTRDSLLRTSASFIMPQPEGANVSSHALGGYIEQKEPGRFSEATLKSLAQK